MKYFKAILFFCVFSTSTTASACYEYVNIGSYTFGRWSNDNQHVGGKTVGTYPGQESSRFTFDHSINHNISVCHSFAFVAKARGIRYWPDSRNEIIEYFDNQEMSCKNYFHEMHNKYANQLCR